MLFRACIIPIMLGYLLAAAPSWPQAVKKGMVIDNISNLNMVSTDSGMVWHGVDVRLRVDDIRLESDSVVWLFDHDIFYFFGHVEAYDSTQHVWADSAGYFHRDSVLLAYSHVVMIHNSDSIRAEADYAEYDLAGQVIYLTENPWLYLNYPDAENLVKITADHLTFFRDGQWGEAENRVQIIHQKTRATCGCAEFFRQQRELVLLDQPVARRDSSIISGEYMTIEFDAGQVRLIDVQNEAKAFFVEEADSSAGEYSGESTLTGEEIVFHFRDDEIRRIAANGAARSEYYPDPQDTTGNGKNFVSGDSIFIFVENRRISKAEIRGGAEGVYITPSDQISPADSAAIGVVDSASSGPCDTCHAVILDRETYEARYETSAAGSDSGAVSATDSGLTAAAPAEDSIHYRGAFLEFFARERVIRITGAARVRQGTVVLDANRIDYDIPEHLIVAEALVDSTDSIPKVQPLALKDGGEEIYGTKLVFNVDTKRGLIEEAATKYERTHYRGDDLYKEEEKVFYVQDGILIPCDKEEPNFHFHSRRMKVIQDDRVIARPVTLYIYKLPVAYIPYYVFPLKRGRHSGILPVRLGNFEKGNRYIGNLGYYWAASEYWDFEGSLDYFENSGITINSLFRYNRRYAYSGYVRGTYAFERRELAFNEQQSRRWTISGNHTQTLPYDISFGASGTFISDKSYYTDYSTDPDERRNRNIKSQANFSKRFSGASLSLSINHQNNLDSRTRSSNLPSGRFSVTTFYPFGSGKEIDGQLDKRWYNYLRLGYANSFNYFVSNKTSDAGESRKKFAYLDHDITLSAAQTIFGYLSLSPSLNGTETWYYIPATDQAAGAGIIGDRPYRRGALSASLSANTNLYGTFPINLFGLIAMRHVMTPSVGFSWGPPITKNNQVKSFTGRGGGGGRRMALSMSLTHLLQAKAGRDEKEKKLDIIRVSTNTSYNFEAPDRKFSDLQTSFSSSMIPNFNLGGNLVHELYDDDGKLIWRKPRLRSFSLNTSFQARGSVSDDYTRQGLSGAPDYAGDLAADTLGGMPSPYGPGEQRPAEGTGTSWNLNLSHNYSQAKGGFYESKTHWIQLTFNLDLTKNWRLKYSQRYDFITHQTIDKIIDLHRQINCWEGHFYWIPDGSRNGFYFKIFLTAIPDLKVEKSESGLRGALFNR